MVPLVLGCEELVQIPHQSITWYQLFIHVKNSVIISDVSRIGKSEVNFCIISELFQEVHVVLNIRADDRLCHNEALLAAQRVGNFVSHQAIRLLYDL